MRSSISTRTKIATDSSACSLSQIRKQLLFPEMQRDHKHSNLLEQIVSMMYASPEPICFYKVKAIVALPEMNVQMHLPNTLPYMTEVMMCTLSLQLQTVMHTHTSSYRLAAKNINQEHSRRRGASTPRLRALSDLKAKLKTEMCKSHRLGTAKKTQGKTITGRTLDLW